MATRRFPSRIKTLALSLLSGIFLLIVAVFFAIQWFLDTKADELVQSPAFKRMIEDATDKGLKLKGHYGPLKRDGTWTVITPSYESQGRPGEAIAYLNAQGISATFNPWGVFKNQWEVSRIDLTTAQMGLRAPDDALKIPFPVGQRPWYAFIMPQRFVPVVTECPKTDLSFEFMGGESHVTGMKVQVFPYGAKDWRIVGEGGDLAMKLLPPLIVKNLEFITSRTFLDFQNFLLLSPPDQGRGRVEGRARLGMHEDQSLKFSVRLSDLPISFALPGDLGQAISGTAQGWVTYHRLDKARTNESGSGQMVLKELKLENLPAQKSLAKFTGDPRFETISFETASLTFSLKDGAFRVPSLRLNAPGLLDMAGHVDSNPDKQIHLDMDLLTFPLDRWLPADVKDHVQGNVTGRFLITGQPDNLRAIEAWTYLTVRDGKVSRLPLLRQIYETYGLHRLRNVPFQQADFMISYGADLLEVKSFEIKSPDLIDAHGYASLSEQGKFHFISRFSLPNIESTLPKKWSQTFSGDIEGRIEVKGRRKERESVSAVGWVDAPGLQVKDLAIQFHLARFFNDSTWLNLAFTQCRVDYSWKDSGLKVQNIDAMVPERLALRGEITIAKDKKLSGQLQLGCSHQIVSWLGSPGRRLFPLEKENLFWADVRVSGTSEQPEIDLVARLRSAILSDPILLGRVAIKAISWVLGDWLSPGRFEIPQ